MYCCKIGGYHTGFLFGSPYGGSFYQNPYQYSLYLSSAIRIQRCVAARGKVAQLHHIHIIHIIYPWRRDSPTCAIIALMNKFLELTCNTKLVMQCTCKKGMPQLAHVVIKIQIKYCLLNNICWHSEFSLTDLILNDYLNWYMLAQYS